MLKIFFFVVALTLCGCNSIVNDNAILDPEIYPVNKGIRLKPTCLGSTPKSIQKIELLSSDGKVLEEIQPHFDTDGLFWAPNESHSGRYRLRFTCNQKLCYSKSFVVDGALDDLGKPIRHR